MIIDWYISDVGNQKSFQDAYGPSIVRINNSHIAKDDLVLFSAQDLDCISRPSRSRIQDCRCGRSRRNPR